MLIPFLRPKTTTNPVFYAEDFRQRVTDPERVRRALEEDGNADVLTWNVFASLDTHEDRDWLAYRLQAFGGTQVHGPIRIALWTGRDREPLLRPSNAYLTAIRERARAAGADDGDLSDFARPIEVPVRIESPDVLMLVDTSLGGYPRGAGGRDRLVELLDAGIDAARRLDKALAVAVVYPSGTEDSGELSARLHQLRDKANLAAALPHRDRLPEVHLREIGWQQLLRIWESESGYLDLGGQPVKAFLRHCERLGLR